MANTYECPSCGNLCQSEEAKCPYCGTPTPNGGKDRKVFTINTPPIPGIKFEQDYSRPESEKKHADINVCLLIFLVIIFWPAAIVYVIVKMNEKK